MAEETKLRKIKVFAYILLTFVFITGIALYLKIEHGCVSSEISKALTEKNGYSKADELKIEIENKESKAMCFSSCYPYVIQTKKGDWSNYEYPECNKENIAETCIQPGQSKAFEISLSGMFLRASMHRLAMPACIGCAVGEQFRVDKIIYSNEFEIK